ncbi:hypothetical protein [Paraburkholderia hayleyella]|uniref:hypothetical protein n=1 Tax=Paraburkholderia hayleyella TaxID=2152889 RepID=UPI001FE66FEE|nr:hypothetical protein [Paraburkholderia hayleyella]
MTAPDHTCADHLSAPASKDIKSKRPTILRRLLSHHELATMLLLLHAPIDAAAKPEIPLLEEAGLVEMAQAETGSPVIRLTPEGNAVLRGLGVVSGDRLHNT